MKILLVIIFLQRKTFDSVHLKVLIRKNLFQIFLITRYKRRPVSFIHGAGEKMSCSDLIEVVPELSVIRRLKSMINRGPPPCIKREHPWFSKDEYILLVSLLSKKVKELYHLVFIYGLLDGTKIFLAIFPNIGTRDCNDQEKEEEVP